MTRGPSEFANKILASLDAGGYERLGPKLKPIELAARQVLYKPHERIRTVYFPENTVLCMVTVMKNGQTIEAGTVGREGACWISASFGAPQMPCETMVTIKGNAYSLGVEALDREIKQNGHFHDLVSKYSHALLIHEMRIAACNGLHSLQQRCARWMLTTLDRIAEDRFSITHDFLALLLGARRASISVIAEDFEKAGIIKLDRGQITIADRKLLESCSCECYGIIKDTFDRVGV